MFSVIRLAHRWPLAREPFGHGFVKNPLEQKSSIAHALALAEMSGLNTKAVQSSTAALPAPDPQTIQRIRLVLLMVAILLAAALTSVAAEHPEQDRQLAAKTGLEFQPRLGEYHYEIRWARKRVATGMITIRKERDAYVLTADQRTTAFIDRIYRVRYRGETRIDSAALTPLESVIEQEVKKHSKVQTAQYDSISGSVRVEETRKKGEHDPGKTKTYELQSDTGILDVFSAIFLARSFDWSIGERHDFLVFIGEKQYAVVLDCIGMHTLEFEENRIPVWVIQPQIRNTTNTQPSSAAQKTRIFIAADESKDIVKIETEPGIGTVTLRLVRFLDQ